MANYNKNGNMINEFKEYLYSEEKSKATIEKYIRDVNAFAEYLGGREIIKEVAVDYKRYLSEKGYAVRSINSMIASINSFFEFIKKPECRIKNLKIQKSVYRSEEKELTKAEYIRLLNAANKQGKYQLNLILQTICVTGIRVSELKLITVEAVKRGEAVICCKGKTRYVFIVKKLQKKLLQYIKCKKIKTGYVFVTDKGNPIDRSNIWRQMKKLCVIAEVGSKKVFPHNLRRLFAREFYKNEKDIAKLADILGHSNIETTRIYIVSTGYEHRRRMENMKLVI